MADRNSPRKHLWRARIILATGEGCGTAEIMRRAGVSKPSVWRWQRRFMDAGVECLLREKTRKPGLPPLPPSVSIGGRPHPGRSAWRGRALGKSGHGSSVAEPAACSAMPLSRNLLMDAWLDSTRLGCCPDRTMNG